MAVVCEHFGRVGCLINKKPGCKWEVETGKEGVKIVIGVTKAHLRVHQDMGTASMAAWHHPGHLCNTHSGQWRAAVVLPLAG